jgi:hypothetical protein
MISLLFSAETSNASELGHITTLFRQCFFLSVIRIHFVLLKTVSRELANYVGFSGSTESHMGQGVTEPADDYTFFCRYGNTKYHLVTGFFEHEGII